MSHLNRNELDRALARFLDGELEPGDGEILSNAIRANKAFEREFVLVLMVSDLLRQHAVPNPRAFIESLESQLEAEAEAGDDEFVQALRRRLDDEVPVTRPAGHRRRIVLRVAVLLLSASCAIFLGNPQWWPARRQPRKDAPIPPLVAVDAETVPRMAGLKKPVAVLTRVVNARWERSDTSYYEGYPLPAGRLRLESGLVQIEFASGASVIVEGPCDLELVSSDKVVCHRGKLRTHVPQLARGFTVVALGVQAIDRGTEFAMSVDEQGRGQVHVVEGEVELQAASADADAVFKSLKTGQGADFSSDGVLREIPGDATKFVDYSRLIQLEDAHLRRRQQLWLAHSRALRADPAVVLYYSFEDANTWQRTLRNVAEGGSRSLDGSVVGCLWCPGRWPGKTALEFKRTSDRVRFNIPGQFHQLSLAAWVRVEGLNQWYSALMLTDDFDPGEAHWQFTGTGQVILGVSAAEEGQRNVDYGSRPVLGPSDLGQWVHIATVYDKPHNRVAHYVNGSCVFEKALRYPIALRIGAATIGNWNWTPASMPGMPYEAWIRSLNGRIDEFVILRRALSGAEIKTMYDLGKPSS